jgi:anti-sigma factor RsiW
VTCQEFAGFIADYLAGDLEEEVRTRFSGHLTRCANCRIYLSSYQATIGLGPRAFRPDDSPVPDDVPNELIAAILSARARG